MANYYTQFSFMLEITKEQREFLVKHFEDRMEEDEEDDAYAALDCLTTEDDGLWIHNDESLPEALLEGIQALLAQFPNLKPVAFEAALTCSKPRVDAFGGLAVRITAQEIKVKSTSELVDEWAADDETK